MQFSRSLSLKAVLVIFGVGLSGCVTLPAPRTLACADSPKPAIKSTSDDTRASTTLDVLTYNIEGLPWPARSGRKAALYQIGQILDEMRTTQTGPDVVLFQEAFSSNALDGINRAGYPALVAGPARAQRGTLKSDLRLPGRKSPTKGELGIRLMTSGLAIASRYPIIAHISEPYSRGSCAGFDCLANKGILSASIAIPGVPDAVEIINTHMNSQGASKVAPERHLASHAAQMQQVDKFFETYWDRTRPVIFGGDFNMRSSPQRFDMFRLFQPLELVHQYCVAPEHKCDVRLTWDGDAPWMDTQDLQLFTSGARVAVRPIRVQAMFDGSEGNPLLSDHDGFRVTYELSWDKTNTYAGCKD